MKSFFTVTVVISGIERLCFLNAANVLHIPVFCRCIEEAVIMVMKQI